MFVLRPWTVWVFGIFGYPLLMWLTMFPMSWLAPDVEIEDSRLGEGVAWGILAVALLVPATAMALTLWKKDNGFFVRMSSVILGGAGVTATGYALWQEPVRGLGLWVPFLWCCALLLWGFLSRSK